jgi:uracil-DNA glycosylase family 4
MILRNTNGLRMLMETNEREALMRQFSDLCDQAKAVVGGGPYVHTELDFHQAAVRLSSPPADPWKEVQEQVAVCRKCRLCEERHHTVFGEGVLHPLVMVIGEGPGTEEDASGRPFVGRGGQYLDKWLAPIGLSRDTNVYIANVVKCRPPQNRTPEPDEIEACLPYLKRQIELVQPKLILLSGSTAAHAILRRPEGVGKLRGQTFDYEGIPVVVTYHPAGVLRNPEYRRPVWEDMKRIAHMLDLPILGKK